tara:strand:+ start:200 stop:550 length:351 start_codon:yes stop_codon:yes gene_type:complete
MVVKNTRLETEQRILVAVVLILVVALAWNNAFSELFKNNPSLQLHGPWVYAFVITILVVFLHKSYVNSQEESEKADAVLKEAVRKELLKEVVTEEVITEEEPETFANLGHLDFSQQ